MVIFSHPRHAARNPRSPALPAGLASLSLRWAPAAERRVVRPQFRALVLLCGLAVISACSSPSHRLAHHQRRALPVFGVYAAAYEESAASLPVEIEGRPKLYMAQRPLVTAREIKSVSEVRDEFGLPAVKILFTEAGAAVMRGHSASHLQEFLVFMVDGRPLMAPMITSPITEDFTLVEGSVSSQQVETLLLLNPAN